jgi:hypothetical protein
MFLAFYILQFGVITYISYISPRIKHLDNFSEINLYFYIGELIAILAIIYIRVAYDPKL